MPSCTAKVRSSADKARHMPRRGLRNRIAEPGEQSRSRQDLGRQRFWRRIETGKKRQTLARVRRRNPGKQMEVVVDNFLGNRLTSDIDDPRPRQLQKHQHAQHAFFVMVGARHPRHHILVEAQARDDHYGAWRTWIRENLAKQVRQARLQVAEGREFGSRASIQEIGGLRTSAMGPTCRSCARQALRK